MANRPLRRLRRFISSSPLPGPGGSVQLPQDQSRHLKNILRLKAGDGCLVFDKAGSEAEATVSHFTSQGEAVVMVERAMRGGGSFGGQRLYLRAFLALPQRGKMDGLVEKAQELGIQEMIPLETRRTVLKIAEDSRRKVLERWQRIVQEASKQSGNVKLMQVHPPQTFQKALKQIFPGQATVLFHPSRDAMSFAEFVEGFKGPSCPDVWNLFWGPEGGFTEKEVEAVRNQKGKVVNLGRSILKVDTAFLGVISALRFLFSESYTNVKKLKN